jgi:hypothetical protein
MVYDDDKKCELLNKYFSLVSKLEEENIPVPPFENIFIDYSLHNFTNSKKEGNTVIRELSKILSEMGMRLNGEKTYHYFL